MNWGFIGWVLGILLTLYVLKFAILALRSIFSRDTMESIMSSTGERISEMNAKVTNKIKAKAAQRKAKKQEENKPIIYIR